MSIRFYGPSLPQFAGDGWAVIPIPWTEVAHYWRHTGDAVTPEGRVRSFTSLCGVERATSSRMPARQRGDVPRCQRCAPMALRGWGAAINRLPEE